MDVFIYFLKNLLPVVLVWGVLAAVYYQVRKKVQVKTLGAQPWSLAGVSWWIGLTAVYLLFSSLVSNKQAAPFIVKIAGVLGLFVPVGILSLLGMGLGKLIVLPFIAHALYMIHCAGRDYFVRPASKIVFYLVALLCLTVIVDFMIWGCWQSLYLFGDQFSCVDLRP